MTVNELQEALIREIGHITEDMEIYDKNGNRTRLKGYPQAIPIFPIYGPVSYTHLTLPTT